MALPLMELIPVGKSSNEDGTPPPHAIDIVGKPSMSRRCTKVVL
jgi:hypothetical protein